MMRSENAQLSCICHDTAVNCMLLGLRMVLVSMDSTRMTATNQARRRFSFRRYLHRGPKRIERTSNKSENKWCTLLRCYVAQRCSWLVHLSFRKYKRESLLRSNVTTKEAKFPAAQHAGKPFFLPLERLIGRNKESKKANIFNYLLQPLYCFR